MGADRTISPDLLERMVRAIEPSWTVTRSEAVDRGHTAVYRLEVEGDGASGRAVLKASPDEAAHGIAAEYRLLEALGRHTSLPVPGVLGGVDRHERLPSPFFLMEAMPGRSLPFEETRHLPTPTLRRLARQTGRYLAELHGLDAVDAFGVLGHDAGRTDGGGLDAMAVRDPIASWPAFLRRSFTPELDAVGDSRFGDVADGLARRFDTAVTVLQVPDDPVLGRIDHGVHNLLLGPDRGEIRALIDWGFTLAVTPGYDLKVVEYVLSGAVLAPLEDADDRRPLVREAMARAYREVRPYPEAELAAAGDLYELMAVVRSMNHLDAGEAKVPDGTEDVVAGGLRRDLDRLLGSLGG